MEIVATKLPGVLLLKPRVFADERGHFVETWSAERYRHAGIAVSFAQDNLSQSKKGVIRGLHLQHPHGQGKLVSTMAGEVFDVAVDVRVGSPTFGQWLGVHLNAENRHQLYIPPGFAHGFCALSEGALFAYKCTETYHPEAELGVRWDDPHLQIVWPTTAPIVSAKDRQFPKLSEISLDRLPQFTAPPS
jgi:dTDP-4-dehydrorhamnose 3,5-epimerase